MRLLLCILALSPAVVLASVDIVRDGKPASEIILPPEALPQVRFAAKELQDHLEKISGALVPIVDVPSGQGVFPIYVGERTETRHLGVSLSELPMEGYRVVASDKALVLAGRDAIFAAVPQGFESNADVPRLTEEWQQYTGKKWTLPRNGLYDPRNRSKQLGFSLYDPTGTLFAVYDFLEHLGVRWYYPDTESGTVLPQQRTITLTERDHSAAPAFSWRFMRWTFPAADPEGFLWFKRQKLGMSEMVWFGHGTPYVTDLQTEAHPEFAAQVQGEAKLHFKGANKTPNPRLAAPLRDEMIDFADKFFQWCPQLNTWPAAPADGFVQMDDRDRAAGWDREERGPTGRFSDYIWNFVNDVAKGVEKKHPDKFVTGLAYGYGRALPRDIEKLNPNLSVVYCQTRAVEMIDPDQRAHLRKEREAWLAKMGNKEFYIWEYYLSHVSRKQLPGVPAVFTRIMQEDARDLRGKSKGEYVECSYGHRQMLNPALNHYPYMVQARLYWEPDLDLGAFLDEYCRKFYGPAAEEMKAFFTYAEEVWMQPGSRMPSTPDFFLKKTNVDRFFELLAAAQAKANSGVYGDRVAAVKAECEPMRGIFSSKEEHLKGVAALEEGHGEAAIRHLQTALASTTDPAARLETLAALGKAYRDTQGDNEAALAAFEEVLEIKPGVVAVPWRRMRKEVLYDAVALLRKEQRFEEARKLLDSLNPEEETGYWRFKLLKTYGDLAKEEGDSFAALQQYTAAIEVPNAPKSLVEKLRKEINH